jgi:hypothetical protein
VQGTEPGGADNGRPSSSGRPGREAGSTVGTWW